MEKYRKNIKIILHSLMKKQVINQLVKNLFKISFSWNVVFMSSTPTCSKICVSKFFFFRTLIIPYCSNSFKRYYIRVPVCVICRLVQIHFNSGCNSASDTYNPSVFLMMLCTPIKTMSWWYGKVDMSSFLDMCILLKTSFSISMVTV